MNRTQRKIKKSLREYEDGRASFKKVYLQPSLVNPDAPINSGAIKDLQKQIKIARKDTRDYSRQITFKEVLEV